MSTKCTERYGDGFHFYRDVFDDDHIYLELYHKDGKLKFVAESFRLTVAIPIQIWNQIKNWNPPEPDNRFDDQESSS